MLRTHPSSANWPESGIEWTPDVPLNERLLYAAADDFGISVLSFNQRTMPGVVLGNQLGMQALRFPLLERLTGSLAQILISNCPLLRILYVPNLENAAGDIHVDTCPLLQIFSFPKLEVVGGNFNVTSVPVPEEIEILNLTSVVLDVTIDLNNGLKKAHFPKLVTVGGLKIRNNAQLLSFIAPLLSSAIADGMDIRDNAALTKLVLGQFVPVNGVTINVSGNALDSDSVTAILASAVANPAYVSGTIDLSGGTNADITSIADTHRATLMARGVSVFPVPPYVPPTDVTVTFGGSSSAGFDYHLDVNLTTFTANSLATLTGPLNVAGCTALTSVGLSALATVTSLDFSGCTSLVTLTLSAITTASGLLNFSGDTALTTLSLDGLTTATGGINASGCSALTTPTLVALTSAGGLLNFSNSGLVTLTLTPLVTASAGIDAHGCPAFTTLTMTNYLPTNGTTINFNGGALTAASVNTILARAVANAAYVSGTINCAGGTNLAPTGQGITDKATLIARGVTVLTN